jgi:hypothetical protein
MERGRCRRRKVFFHLLLEWAADSEPTRGEDGVDTFVFREGLIRVQGVRYTLTHKS